MHDVAGSSLKEFLEFAAGAALSPGADVAAMVLAMLRSSSRFRLF